MHPDGIAGVHTRRYDFMPDTQVYGTQVVLMSVGPEGRTWLDENAPEWREHVSLREFSAETRVSREWLTNPPRGVDIVRECVVPDLHHKIAEAIVKALEPGVTPID